MPEEHDHIGEHAHERTHDSSNALDERERGYLMAALYGELKDEGERTEWKYLCTQKPFLAAEYARLQAVMRTMQSIALESVSTTHDDKQNTLMNEPLANEDAFFTKQWQHLEALMQSERRAAASPVEIVSEITASRPAKQRIAGAIDRQYFRYAVAALLLLSVGVGLSVYRWNAETNIQSTAPNATDESSIPQRVEKAIEHSNTPSNESNTRQSASSSSSSPSSPSGSLHGNSSQENAKGNASERSNKQHAPPSDAAEEIEYSPTPQSLPSTNVRREALPETALPETMPDLEKNSEKKIEQQSRERSMPQRTDAESMVKPNAKTPIQDELSRPPSGGAAPSSSSPPSTMPAGEILHKHTHPALNNAQPNSLMPARSIAPKAEMLSTRATSSTLDSLLRNIKARDSNEAQHKKPKKE